MPKKILVIDDDRTNTTLLKARLEASHFAVVTANDGDVGLEVLKKEKPDLIILDVEMPKMNGYTFLTEMKKLDEFKSRPVIVLTAHENMQPIFGLKGVKGYFVKPLKIEPLLEKIVQCIGPAQPSEGVAPQT